MTSFEKLNAWFVAACRSAHMPPYVFNFYEKKMKKFTMEVDVDKTYLAVTVNVNPSFWKKDLSSQRIYLAHELWHIIAHRNDRVAEEALERLSEEDEEDGSRFERLYLEESEKLADHAAHLLIGLLPEWNGVTE